MAKEFSVPSALRAEARADSRLSTSGAMSGVRGEIRQAIIVYSARNWKELEETAGVQYRRLDSILTELDDFLRRCLRFTI
jgi:protein-disulfide isomerase-like protein with CxxC motif